MKKMMILIIGLITFGQSQGQTINQSLQDSLMGMYNNGNYQGFYNLGSAEWKSNHKPDGIAGWLSWMRSQTGQLNSSSYVRDTGKYQLIRWERERKVTGFMLQPGLNGRFNDFGFTSFKEPLTAAELKRVNSDNPLKTSLDSAVNNVVARFMVYNKAIGLSIGVIKNGKSYTYNYGTVEKGKQEIPTANSFYEIGSIMKTFTSLLLAKAVTDHKLSLQDDVCSYLKGDYSNLQYNGQPLRLINLANYTSAFPPVQILRPFDESTPQAAAAFFKTYSIPEFLEDIKKIKLDTLPGTRYSYSTAGLNLLAYILSQVYNKPFPDLVSQMITEPMGMHNTKLYLSARERMRFPQGYDFKGAEQPDIYGPLDSLDLLHSTVHDMLIYLKHNIDEDSPAIRLSHQQFSDMPHNEAGLGWFLYETPYGKAIGKGGNSVHMSCRAWAVPEKKAGIVCFTNSNQMDWADLVEDIMSVLVKPQQ
jgi:D-alanyl-D-alanine-carboxypeptidase/D-alanyl-D-alanine-endopeptidase